MIPPDGNAEFVAAMERVLDVYRRPYDVTMPVVCMDETPRHWQLWDRFDFVYTPKHGSWLNVAEIELNVMISQCLSRRIDNIEELREEVSAWQAARDQLEARVKTGISPRKTRESNSNVFIRRLMLDMAVVPS